MDLVQCMADAMGRARALQIMGRSCTWEQNARWMKKWFHTISWRQYFASCDIRSYILRNSATTANKACTDCRNNFISPTRHQRHGGQTPWSTYRTHATWIVQYADLWRHCLTLDLSGTVGCLLHQYLVLRAANDQWQDQTTEKRSEALIEWGYWRTKSKRVLVTKNGWRGGDGVAIAIGGYASEEVYYIEAVIELDRLITWKWKRRRRSL